MTCRRCTSLLLIGAIACGIGSKAAAETDLFPTLGPTLGFRAADGAREVGGELGVWSLSNIEQRRQTWSKVVWPPLLGMDLGLTTRRAYAELQLLFWQNGILFAGISPGLAYWFDRAEPEVVTTAWLNLAVLVLYGRIGTTINPLDLSFGCMLKIPLSWKKIGG